jgi:hypothetical protein
VYVALANGTTGTLAAVDVTQLASPSLLGTIAVGAPAEDVALSGHLAFVAAGTAGLVVIDVTEPAAPETLSVQPSLGAGVVAHGVVIGAVPTQTWAFVAADTKGVLAVNVSTLFDPYRGRGGNQPDAPINSDHLTLTLESRDPLSPHDTTVNPDQMPVVTFATAGAARRIARGLALDRLVDESGRRLRDQWNPGENVMSRQTMDTPIVDVVPIHGRDQEVGVVEPEAVAGRVPADQPIDVAAADGARVVAVGPRMTDLVMLGAGTHFMADPAGVVLDVRPLLLGHRLMTGPTVPRLGRRRRSHRVGGWWRGVGRRRRRRMCRWWWRRMCRRRGRVHRRRAVRGSRREMAAATAVLLRERGHGHARQKPDQPRSRSSHARSSSETGTVLGSFAEHARPRPSLIAVGKRGMLPPPWAIKRALGGRSSAGSSSATARRRRPNRPTI